MRTRSLLTVFALVVFSAVVFAGCSWLGKGKEVADAYAATVNAKSASFTGSWSVTPVKKNGSLGKTEVESFSGAYDELDPSRPKFRFTTVAYGETTEIVAPGNGKVYVKLDGDVISTKLGKNKKPTSDGASNKFSSALANAVVNFRDGAPVTRADGTQAPAIVADISRNKLCGQSLRQMVRAFNSEAGSKDLSELRLHISKKETRGMSRGCSKLLPSPPVLTFGIVAGQLTDFVADVELRIDRRFKSHFELHYAAIGQPQTDFVVPKKSKSKPSENPWAPLRRSMSRAIDRAAAAGHELR